eukprot:TRINITY_DN33362_c0_g1_i1.p1 TRINITY_DN33362_c0_g1~~TRINITY_DN33362_c0_g1_i1.p1  ORF type:complete len:488 (-),score=129.03 TRINITY_DN33362_c0_g1_i1:66-1529(-)
MIRRPPRSTLSSSSAASDVYKRQVQAEQHLEMGKRVLCLHGFGQCEEIFELFLPSLQSQFPGYTFDILQGGYKLSSQADWSALSEAGGAKGSELAKVGIDGVISLYGYAPLERTEAIDSRGAPMYLSETERLESSFQDVVAHMEKHGPYEGLLGFSQGGTVGLYALMNWHRASENVRPALEWVATFGTTDLYTERELAVRRAPQGVKLFMCCGSAKDDRGYLDSEACAALHTVPRHLQAHGLYTEVTWVCGMGHEMPSGVNAEHVYSKLRCFVALSLEDIAAKKQSAAPLCAQAEQAKCQLALEAVQHTAERVRECVVDGRLGSQIKEVVSGLDLCSVQQVQRAARVIRGLPRTAVNGKVLDWLTAVIVLLSSAGGREAPQLDPCEAAHQVAGPPPALLDSKVEIAQARADQLRTELDSAVAEGVVSPETLVAVGSLDGESKFGAVQKAVRSVKAAVNKAQYATVKYPGDRVALDWLMAVLNVRTAS